MAIDDNTSYELTGAQIKDFATKIKSKADSSSLAPVATSGDYNDLNNLPTPPTVNNGALTIQQNGTTIGTFTANSSDDKTVNIQTITAETVAPAEEVGAITASMIDWTTIGVTTTTSDGWKKTTIGPNITIYSKTYTTSGTITGTGQGTVACLIAPPAEFSEADVEDIIGESIQDSTAEIYYRRLDSLQRSDGCRVYAVSISGGRTLNGKYAITLMKRS